MRNIIPVIVAGFLLSGCLTKEASNVDENGSATTPDNPGTAGNAAPTISGVAPASVKFDNQYSFLPNATDPDGDTLSFAIQNLPNWASFDASTGRLSGQPTRADVGTYSSIGISVSDGTNKSSLPNFSITVRESALGAITLSWDAPLTNTDGSALTDLAGFTIYYGKSAGRYDRQIQIGNPSVTVYVVDELDPTTYYFTATAFNSSGIESPFTGEIVLTVL